MQSSSVFEDPLSLPLLIEGEMPARFHGDTTVTTEKLLRISRHEEPRHNPRQDLTRWRVHIT